MKVTFTTKKINRYNAVDGYMVQVFVDGEKAPQIDEMLAKHANGVGELEVTIAKKAKKRTLTANNYLWVLCEEIAKAVGSDKESIYQSLIRRVGVFDYVLVKDGAKERFLRNWTENGLGWFAEELPYKEKGITQYQVYYGSSVYTVDEMARVIDEAVMEADNLGIPTKTKEEVKEILENWK